MSDTSRPILVLLDKTLAINPAKVISLYWGENGKTYIRCEGRAEAYITTLSIEEVMKKLIDGSRFN